MEKKKWAKQIPRAWKSKLSMGERVAASFRDPSGFVFFQGEKLFRQVNKVYQQDYDLLISSGLYERLTKQKLLIPHQEVDIRPIQAELGYKVLQPELVDFISYPYEWSFSQLKDAALLTLAIQKIALETGMILKDASAYNIQFHRGRPILIDTLSFTKYVEGEPWIAYRQFCQHFIAPLALMSMVDLRLITLLINHIDGIPLDLCSRLLPRSTRLNFGLMTHIHMQAAAQRRFANTDIPEPKVTAEKKPRVTKLGLIGLIDSLESTVKKLNIKITGKDWANYYSDTNYNQKAFDEKRKIVADLAGSLQPRLILDLGANTGIFSREAAKQADCLVVSADIDPEAVEINYRQLKNDRQTNILPLIVDLTNPSPAIGWDNRERTSFYSRRKADLVMALALIHHLAISNNVPLGDIARSMANLGEYLLLEFVPKEDSQVQRLLRSRDDIFNQYSLEGLLKAFEPHYTLESQSPITDSKRTILLFKRKSRD